MLGGFILSAGRCHFLRDVEGATGQSASLASTSGPLLHLLTAGRRLGPSLHLWQLVAAALVKALARKIKKRGLGVGIQIYGSQTFFIV